MQSRCILLQIKLHAVHTRSITLSRRNTCTMTDGKGTWRVDLGDNYSVEKIWIKNRVDGYSERLDGVEVLV